MWLSGAECVVSMQKMSLIGAGAKPKILPDAQLCFLRLVQYLRSRCGSESKESPRNHLVSEKQLSFGLISRSSDYFFLARKSYYIFVRNILFNIFVANTHITSLFFPRLIVACIAGMQCFPTHKWIHLVIL